MGVESDEKSTIVKPERTGVAKENYMALVEESTAEAELNIAVVEEILARNADKDIREEIEDGDSQFDEEKVETEETQYKDMIYMDE